MPDQPSKPNKCNMALCLAQFEASPFKKVPRRAGPELRGLYDVGPVEHGSAAL
jgi:hypothetical protein